MRSMRLAITNQKGGVGKTTTAINLAASLYALGCKVLLVDLDPQGHATMGSGIDKSLISPTLNEVLQGESDLSSALIAHTAGGFTLLPSNGDLTAAEAALVRHVGQEDRLKKALAGVEDRFDFILMDCPPSLTMLTVNGLVASEAVIVPMPCEYFALEGLTALLDTIEQIRLTLNPTLSLGGVLRTLYDARSRLTHEVSEQLSIHFGEKLFQTVIPRNVRLAEAPSHGLPILKYDAASKGSLAYGALAKEILARYPMGRLAS